MWNGDVADGTVEVNLHVGFLKVFHQRFSRRNGIPNAAWVNVRPVGVTELRCENWGCLVGNRPTYRFVCLGDSLFFLRVGSNVTTSILVLSMNISSSIEISFVHSVNRVSVDLLGDSWR
ncbi:hypothetical protein ACFFRR_011482 [Megaselia abdita]